MPRPRLRIRTVMAAVAVAAVAFTFGRGSLVASTAVAMVAILHLGVTTYLAHRRVGAHPE